MADSVIDQLRQLEQEKAKLDEQKAKLLANVEKELVGNAEAAVKALHDHGFTQYRLQKIGSGSTSSRKGTRQTNPDRECPICKFKTNPPHDARRHRSQAVKKPFTAEELSEMGLERVS